MLTGVFAINSKVNTQGSTKQFQALSGNLEIFTVWCASTGAVSDPEAAQGIALRITGDVRDITQKNFEILVQSIGLRASPVIVDLPRAVSDLSVSGADVLTGEGYVWCFGTERRSQFARSGQATALLVEELDGVVLANGVIVRTTGAQQNIEFAARETVCS